MIATQLAPAEVRTAAREKLLAHAAAEGGFGYDPGHHPQLEPTALALVALAASGSTPADLAPHLDAVLGWQQPDGRFRTPEGHPNSLWPSAFAAWLLAELRPESPALGRVVAWLFSEAGQRVPNNQDDQQNFDIDSTIQGWPWTLGTFSWVEPTAWSCIALKRAGYGAHPRVREGLRLLMDRAFDEGGINYGNRRVFGRGTEPVPADTAAFLLAFVGEPEQPKLAAARRFLLQAGENTDDLEVVCWARIALTPWAESDLAVQLALPELDRRVAEQFQERQGRSYLPESNVRLALTLLALAEKSPFIHAAPDSRLASPPTPLKRRMAFGDRLQAGFRGLMINAMGRMRAVTVPATIHIGKAASYEEPLVDLLWSQYAAFRTTVPLKDRRVVLKPNLVEYHPGKAINTHPAVIAAVIELCQREGAREVIVAEGPGHWRNTEYILHASGLGAHLQRLGVKFVDLNHDDPVETPNLGRCTKMEYLYLAKTVVEAEVFISLPKLKTHHWAGVTLSIKNLFGIMPGQSYGWPKNELHWQGIDKSAVDIVLTRTPDLAIVDGIVGMEGDGPLNGEAKPLGAIIMGQDPLAVDATCCRLMGLLPEKVGYLQLAEQKRLGVLKENQIIQLGSSIAEMAKEFEPHPRFGHLKSAPQ